MFQPLVQVGGAVLGAYGAFKRWSRLEEVHHWGHILGVASFSLLMPISLLVDGCDLHSSDCQTG